MRYYQHHIGDFIKDTSYLTNEEVGIYLKLLWLYYDTEQALPKDIFVLSIKANARENEPIVIGILNMFFIESDDGWHHTRCDQEIAHYHAQIETASKAGKASAAKRAFNASSTSVQPTNNQEPITKNHKPIKSIAPPEGVDVSLFKDYLEVRKAKKAKWTETAYKGLQREADKAKMSLSDVMQMCCERGWAGFKAEWVAESVITQKKNPLITNDQIEEAYRIECGKDPKLARFNSYYEMKDYVIKQREIRARGDT
jgi:uncharacterized protein YdaU (DUF1376 family)